MIAVQIISSPAIAIASECWELGALTTVLHPMAHHTRVLALPCFLLPAHPVCPPLDYLNYASLNLACLLHMESSVEL